MKLKLCIKKVLDNKWVNLFENLSTSFHKEMFSILVLVFGYRCLTQSADINYLSGIIAGAVSVVYGVNNSRILKILAKPIAKYIIKKRKENKNEA